MEQALNFKKQKKDIFLKDPKASSELDFYEILLYNHLFLILSTAARMLFGDRGSDAVGLRFSSSLVLVVFDQ